MENEKKEPMEIILSKDVNGALVDGYFEDGQAWYTRTQIGQALGYEFPAQSVGKIHNRHKERLDLFSRVSQFDSPSGVQEGYVYNIQGVFEICRWSRQPVADAVMDGLYAMAEEVMRKGYYSALPDEVLVQKVVENASDKERLRSVIIPALRDADVLQEDFVTEYMGLKPYDVGGKLGTVSFNNQVAKRTIERWKEFGGKVWSEDDVPERYRDDFHFKSALMSYSRARDNYGKFVKYCGKTFFNKDGYIKVIDGMVKRGNITKEEAAEWKLEEKLR